MSLRIGMPEDVSLCESSITPPSTMVWPLGMVTWVWICRSAITPAVTALGSNGSGEATHGQRSMLRRR